MRKIVSASRLAVFALCALSLAGWPAHGQGKIKKPALVRQGMVQDWSHRHVVYPRGGSLRTLMILQHDPRAMQSWQAASRANWHRPFKGRNFKKSGFHRDWSISLGAGGTAPAMYPAKYNFDVNATPSCTNDFIVYPVNAAGGASQPNLVGFNNLYSGTVPSNGICNRAPVASVDDGVSATTMWSYNINGGTVATSPALSLDGTKVAFVETVGGVAHFHVLAWKSGDGVGSNLQTVTGPVTIDGTLLHPFATNAPVAGSGTASDLTLGSAADTLSSPFVDYYNDLAYIGNDTGTLYRVKDVFCFTLACSGGTTPAPSLDTTWGGSGALATGCAGKLSGPVVDGVTGNIFVGCADGKLYGFTSAGVALASSPVTVGDGTAKGGIVDPPMLDVTNGFVYVVSGSSPSSGPAVLVQVKESNLTVTSTATLGKGNVFNLHAPSFNDAYFSSGTSSNWLLYEWAYDSGGTQIELYAAAFDGSRNM
ncbi:MAG: hypothetical protein LAN59_15155, partial [Acidobacteriia bacterium]|nr:hypothetical protein [Terriglobia bacterium]